VSLEQIGCYEDLAETSDTMEGNSLQKAQYVFDNYKLSCFADDSGLEVDALHGAPGVYSARYAGPQRDDEDNIQLLLKNLSGITNRNARFRTVITLIQDDGSVKTFEGVVAGNIIHEKKGIDGFGYDPIFQPDGYSQTFAEMTLEAKNKMSHRSRAMQKLVAYLRESV
jgi:XTP/dITP diphosphohydrolase